MFPHTVTDRPLTNGNVFEPLSLFLLAIPAKNQFRFPFVSHLLSCSGRLQVGPEPWPRQRPRCARPKESPPIHASLPVRVQDVSATPRRTIALPIFMASGLSS